MVDWETNHEVSQGDGWRGGDEAPVPPLLYLSGPMTGVPEYNAPLFRRVAGELRRQGYRVYDPHEYSKEDTSKPWAEYMRGVIRVLLDCDRLVLLPGWQDSKGAKLEAFIAASLGIQIQAWSDDRGLVDVDVAA